MTNEEYLAPEVNFPGAPGLYVWTFKTSHNDLEEECTVSFNEGRSWEPPSAQKETVITISK